MGVSIQLSWCKLGEDLVDLLFLHLLWVLCLPKVVSDIIVPHLLSVTICVWNLMQSVIVMTMNNFASVVFNVIEAFADSGANLMLVSDIIIWLWRMDVHEIGGHR